MFHLTFRCAHNKHMSPPILKHKHVLTHTHDFKTYFSVRSGGSGTLKDKNL